MEKQGSTSRLATAPDLKSDERDERLGGSTPSASVCTFRRQHQSAYQAADAVLGTWSISGKPLNLGSNEPNEGPQGDDLGPFFIMDDSTEQEKDNMPAALPPKPKYNQASAQSPSPKMAFENLVTEAWRLKEDEKRRELAAFVSERLKKLDQKVA